MKFSEGVGGYTSDAEQAAEYLRTWFRPEDLVNVVGIAEGSTSGGLQSDTYAARELHDDFKNNPESIDTLIMNEDGEFWNVYVSVGSLKSPVRGKRRAKKYNIARLPGVWADIDVKDGSFASQDEIMEWVRGLECTPTMIVGSGSGGIHLYWKYAKDREKLEVYDPTAWWSYLDYSAGDRSIDKLADITRILRLPGTAYFPKDMSEAKISNVTLLENTGLQYNPEDLRAFADPYHKKLEEKLSKYLDKEEETVLNVVRNHYDLNRLTDKKTMGARVFAIANLQLVEEKVNASVSWDEILENAGWSKTATFNDGSKQWKRPGPDASKRSAVVDWPDSEGNVMSLVSGSPDTGLLDLKEAGIPLTKFRVMLRLIYEDDTHRLIQDVLNGNI